MDKKKALVELWCIYAALVIDGDDKKVRGMRRALLVLDPGGPLSKRRAPKRQDKKP